MKSFKAIPRKHRCLAKSSLEFTAIVEGVQLTIANAYHAIRSCPPTQGYLIDQLSIVNISQSGMNINVGHDDLSGNLEFSTTCLKKLVKAENMIFNIKSRLYL